MGPDLPNGIVWWCPTPLQTPVAAACSPGMPGTTNRVRTAIGRVLRSEADLSGRCGVAVESGVFLVGQPHLVADFGE